MTHLRECDVILQNRAGGLQIISDLHPAYVPLYYVLLFPYGENGWHPDLRFRLSNDHAIGKCLTHMVCCISITSLSR